MADEIFAIELKGITKTFGSVVANDNIHLTVKHGEILALLGENGSGKTTLMNMLSGIYHPDGGSITVRGNEVFINSPKDAFALGIGMIHQHFKLVDVLSASENIVMGTRAQKRQGKAALSAEITEISRKFGLQIDPGKKIYNMSVSEKQTVEILKVLYRGADILILDEPTSALDPELVGEVLEVMRKLAKSGMTMVVVTHEMGFAGEAGDVLAFIDKGVVGEIGEPAEVLSNPKSKRFQDFLGKVL